MSRAQFFVAGWVLGSLTVGILFGPSVSADHLGGPCRSGTLTEAARENDVAIELGGKGKIQLSYLDGGPVGGGGLVRSLFAWRNFDNWAEVGWKWYDIQPSDPSPKFFAFWIDAGNARPQPWEEGGAGNRNSWSNYKLDNDGGDHWTFHAGGSQVHQHTFENLNANVFIWGNSEVKNLCDSAVAHFKDLLDKNCADPCQYVNWVASENYQIGTENDCHHVDIVSATVFDVLHGPGAGEIC